MFFLQMCERPEGCAMKWASDVLSLWNKSFNSGAWGHNADNKTQRIGLRVCSHTVVIHRSE